MQISLTLTYVIPPYLKPNQNQISRIYVVDKPTFANV
jgi:hypothetical protein